jgi:hypothetical protein
MLHATKKDIKSLFRMAGELHRAGYHTKITRTDAGAPTTPTTVVDEPIILSWAMLATNVVCKAMAV